MGGKGGTDALELLELDGAVELLHSVREALLVEQELSTAHALVNHRASRRGTTY